MIVAMYIHIRFLFNEIKSGARMGAILYKLKRHILEKFKIVYFDQILFKNSLARVRTELGYYDVNGDFQRALNWMRDQTLNADSFYNIHLDEDNRASGLFFMTYSMIQNFHRNGQLLVMDGTCKTNRYDMNLFLITGVDHHGNSSIMAVSLLKNSDEYSYSWILESLREAVGNEAFNSIRSVMTDGEQSITNAVDAAMRNVKRLRCRWHIEQNILAHAQSLSKPSLQSFIEAFHHCENSSSSESFHERWNDLMQNYPSISAYMRENIYTTRQHWCSAWTSKCLSFNAHTTQRSESMNNVIKRMGAADDWSVYDLLVAIRTLVENQDSVRSGKDEVQLKTKRHSMEMFKNCTNFAHTIATQYFSFDLIMSAVAVNGSDTDYIVTEINNARTMEYAVSVTSTAVTCSCNFPTKWLLPCRHVIEANKLALKSGFIPTQVHPKWLLTTGIVTPRSVRRDRSAVATRDMPLPDYDVVQLTSNQIYRLMRERLEQVP